MQKMMSMSKDDMVVSSLSSGFDRFREWPYCVGTPEGMRDQAFMPRHARLALALTGQPFFDPCQHALLCTSPPAGFSQHTALST